MKDVLASCDNEKRDERMPFFIFEQKVTKHRVGTFRIILIHPTSYTTREAASDAVRGKHHEDAELGYVYDIVEAEDESDALRKARMYDIRP